MMNEAEAVQALEMVIDTYDVDNLTTQSYVRDAKRAVVYLHHLASELRKWEQLHDEEDLRALRKQSQTSGGMAGMQAYINGLEHALSHANKKIKELEGK